MSVFHPRFIGLTGSPDEIAAAAAEFGMYCQKHEGMTAGGYLVDLTVTTTAIGADGRARPVWPYSTPAEDIASDLAHLIQKER